MYNPHVGRWWVLILCIIANSRGSQPLGMQNHWDIGGGSDLSWFQMLYCLWCLLVEGTDIQLLQIFGYLYCCPNCGVKSKSESRRLLKSGRAEKRLKLPISGRTSNNQSDNQGSTLMIASVIQPQLRATRATDAVWLSMSTLELHLNSEFYQRNRATKLPLHLGFHAGIG